MFGGGNIQLNIGSLTVDPADVTANSCLQVPIFINDPQGARDLLQVTFTVEITGDTGIITGGIAAEMLVVNGFTAGSLTGITNPGTVLSNNNSGTGAPACPLVFNQATEGSGAAVDFFGGATNANTFINNDLGAVGRKQGTSLNLTAAVIGQTVANTDHLIGVLVIPVNATPGPSQLTVTAVPNMTVTDGNIYIYDDGTDAQGNRVAVQEDLDLSNGPGIVNIFAPEDCTNATIADNLAAPFELGENRGGPLGINYLDPQAGGVGGDITFTMPHSANVDQITITSDNGFNTTIPATGTQTMLTINTQGDGSPSTAVSTETYTIVYEIEFPAASGNFVAGGSCIEAVTWNPTSCTVACDPNPPVFGNPVAIDVTLSNVVYDAGNTRFAVLTSDATNFGADIDLDTPSSVSGNVLTYDDAYSIGAVGAGDVGNYSTSTTGPGVGNTGNCNHFLSLDPPVNNVDCNAITAPVSIEGMATITLVGDNVVTWDITYDGNTTNVPGTDATFDVMNLVGDQTQVTIAANGFNMGVPTSDTIMCTLDFADAVCVDTQQNPDSTVTPVDVGTVITLTLVTTGAVSATIDGVPMTPDVDPNDNNNVNWTANHTAVVDTVVTAVITNPDGTTANCTWIIDINCETPVLVSVPPVGGTGITISGTPGCTYDVSITTATLGCQVVQITVGADGMGVDNVFVMPPDAFCAISQQTFGCTGPIGLPSSVPTLGEWGLMAFVLMLMASAVWFMRKRRLA